MVLFDELAKGRLNIALTGLSANTQDAIVVGLLLLLRLFYLVVPNISLSPEGGIRKRKRRRR